MDDGKKPVYEHIKELRYRFLVSIIFILIFSIISYFFYDLILNLLISPLKQKLIFLGPQDAFIVKLKISIFVGFLTSFPLIIYNIYRFISAGLQRKYTLFAFILILSNILFVISILFTYFIALQVGLSFLLGFSNEILTPQIAADRYFSFIFSVFLSLLLVFQLPLFILTLAKFRFIDDQILRKNRKYALLIIFILAALVTPPDVITLFLLVIPLVLLYEFSIFLVRIFCK